MVRDGTILWWYDQETVPPYVYHHIDCRNGDTIMNVGQCHDPGFDHDHGWFDECLVVVILLIIIGKLGCN